MSAVKIAISRTEANGQNYWNWFTERDLRDDLELVELSCDKENLNQLSECSGLILTGGVDVLPELYGAVPEYPNMPYRFLPERDIFEKQLYFFARDHQIPILGICRGMQYINILEGGKVLEDNGPALHEIHMESTEDRVHLVRLVQGSLIEAISGTEEGMVNSAHHQGVVEEYLSERLLASAYAEGPLRLIEAIEYKDKTAMPFMLAVQWHPERMHNKADNPLSKKLKDAFLKAVRDYSGKSF